MGNHSWSHRKSTSLSSEEQLQELEKKSTAIKNATKRDVEWFCPPCGYHDDNLIENSNRLNMYLILWTVDSLDWQGDKLEILVKRVISNVYNGAITLFRDHDNKSNTVGVLPQIIKILKKSGYESVTLSEWEERVYSVVKAKCISRGEEMHNSDLLKYIHN